MKRRAVLVCAVLASAMLASTAAAQPKPDALANLLARTDKVAKEVAKIRGLPLRRKIPNEVVDREMLRKRLVTMAGEDKTKAETAAEALGLARWGMIPRATGYEAMLLDLLTEQIAGYYDPDTKKLTISSSAGDDAVWAELVLAHEIDHGLQDQSFDLKKFEDVPDGEDDAAAARRALVEGDGIALMLEVMFARNGVPVPWSNPMMADAIEKAMAVPGNGDTLDKAPIAIREGLIFPYRAGFTFVAALRRRQPWSAVDAAFKKPPTSTEQILHPERYLANDQPVGVAIDPIMSLRGYSLAHRTVWGELGFQLFLRAHGIDAATATQAAAGWGGDRTVVLAKDTDRRAELAVGVSRLEWDSEADAIEAQEAAVKALDAAIAGSVVENTRVRTRWMGVDGLVSWVERKGPSMVIVHGAPVWAAESLLTEVWMASHPTTPARPKAKK